MLPPGRQRATYLSHRLKVKPPKLVLWPTQYDPVSAIIFSFPIREQGDCSVHIKLKPQKEKGKVPSARKKTPLPPNEHSRPAHLSTGHRPTLPRTTEHAPSHLSPSARSAFSNSCLTQHLPPAPLPRTRRPSSLYTRGCPPHSSAPPSTQMSHSVAPRAALPLQVSERGALSSSSRAVPCLDRTACSGNTGCSLSWPLLNEMG